jgi:hypothetical protein
MTTSRMRRQFQQFHGNQVLSTEHLVEELNQEHHAINELTLSCEQLAGDIRDLRELQVIGITITANGTASHATNALLMHSLNRLSRGVESVSFESIQTPTVDNVLQVTMEGIIQTLAGKYRLWKEKREELRYTKDKWFDTESGLAEEIDSKLDGQMVKLKTVTKESVTLDLGGLAKHFRLGIEMPSQFAAGVKADLTHTSHTSTLVSGLINDGVAVNERLYRSLDVRSDEVFEKSYLDQLAQLKNTVLGNHFKTPADCVFMDGFAILTNPAYPELVQKNGEELLEVIDQHYMKATTGVNRESPSRTSVTLTKSDLQSLIETAQGYYQAVANRTEMAKLLKQSEKIDAVQIDFYWVEAGEAREPQYVSGLSKYKHILNSELQVPVLIYRHMADGCIDGLMMHAYRMPLWISQVVARALNEMK